MSHACEVLAIVGEKSALAKLERVELSFIRTLLGVPKHTSAKLVLVEWGRLPVSHFWFQQCLKDLNRLI